MSNPRPAATGAPWYGILFLITVVAAGGGIATLWPASGATYPNLLGYRSFCTFAPAASLYCFLVAGITCTVRATLVKRRRLYGKPVVNKGAIVILAIVLAAAVATTAWFVIEKRSYTQADTTTAATEEP